MTSPKPVIVLGGAKRNTADSATSKTPSSKNRRYASVLTTSRRKNVAVSLVMQGLAEIVRHRHDDPRSRYFDLLLDAEVKAHHAKRGIHSKNEPPNNKFRDLTLLKSAVSRLEMSSLIRLGRTYSSSAKRENFKSYPSYITVSLVSLHTQELLTPTLEHRYESCGGVRIQRRPIQDLHSQRKVFRVLCLVRVEMSCTIQKVSRWRTLSRGSVQIFQN